MGRQPEVEEEDWEPPLGDVVVEISSRLEARRGSLFLRVDRQREDYFADVEDDLPLFDLADHATWRYNADRSVTRGMLLEEQPTRLVLCVDQPTLILSLISIEALPTLPLLVAVARTRENGNPLAGGLLRCSRWNALSILVRSCLRMLRI